MKDTKAMYFRIIISVFPARDPAAFEFNTFRVDSWEEQPYVYSYN